MSTWTGQVTVASPGCCASGFGQIVRTARRGRADWCATIGLHEFQPKLASAQEVTIQLVASGQVLSGLVVDAPVRMSAAGVSMTLVVTCSTGEPLELR